MSKYIIDIQDVENMEPYIMGEKLVPYVDTAEEAWELARKIGVQAADGGMSCSELAECFGDEYGEYYYNEIMKLSYSEARQKYDEWKKKEQIRVGDEVVDYDGHRVVVLSIDEDIMHYIDKNGFYQMCSDASDHFKKTGRHFPQVEELLKAMKEET